jgi:hypothetical protein
MNDLVSTYKSQGWWKEAEELEEQSDGEEKEGDWRGASFHAD